MLEGKKVDANDTTDLPKLYKMAAKVLNMSPDKDSDTPVNQFLRGAATMVDGLAGIRNSLSDSHGHNGRRVRPSQRHAELVVSLAGSLSNFLMRSLSEKHIVN